MPRLFAISLFLLLFSPSLAHGDVSTVRVVFFSSPDCPFCAVVAEQDLTPLQDQHGEALEILTVDTSAEAGDQALRQIWVDYDVPSTRRGVPTVVIGEHLLVGTREIPEQLPDLIETYSRKGGIGWPPVAGIDEFLEAELPADFYETAADDWRSRFGRDLPGNYVSAALLVLLLLIALVMVPARPWQEKLSRWTPFSLKIGVAGIGLGVALYLTYGETTRQDLFCGPVGQCNIVQHSDMAMLFGVLPLALLGALAYATLLALYLFRRFHSSKWARLTPTIVLGLTVFGFAFSVILTFWQPFVIGATCSWCLISAMTMTACCLFNLGEGRDQLSRLRRDGLDAVVADPLG